MAASDPLSNVADVAHASVNPSLSPEQTSSVTDSGSSVGGVDFVEAVMSNDAHVEPVSITMSPAIIREGRSSAGGSTSGAGSGSEPWAWLKIIAPVALAVALALVSSRHPNTSSTVSNSSIADYYF